MKNERTVTKTLYNGEFKIACYPDRNKNRYELLNGFVTKVYEDYKKTELKEILRDRDLKLSGKKQELVDRLYDNDYENSTKKELKAECKRRKLKLSGSKEDLFKRLRKHNEERISPSTATGVIDKSGPISWWATNCMRQKIEQDLDEGVPYLKTELEDIIKNAQYNYKDVRDEAAEIGTYVHDWAEEFARAKMKGNEAPSLPNKPEEVDKKDWEERIYPQIVAGIEGFVDWYHDHNVKFLEVESIVYSIEDNYWGRFDAIAEVDGEICLIDYKTSKGIYLSHKLQTSGYWKAKEEEVGEKFDKALILHFQKDPEKAKEKGTFNIHEISRDNHKDDYTYYRHALNLERKVISHG